MLPVSSNFWTANIRNTSSVYYWVNSMVKFRSTSKWIVWHISFLVVVCKLFLLLPQIHQCCLATFFFIGLVSPEMISNKNGYLVMQAATYWAILRQLRLSHRTRISSERCQFIGALWGTLHQYNINAKYYIHDVANLRSETLFNVSCRIDKHRRLWSAYDQINLRSQQSRWTSCCDCANSSSIRSNTAWESPAHQSTKFESKSPFSVNSNLIHHDMVQIRNGKCVMLTILVNEKSHEQTTWSSNSGNGGIQ